MTPPPEMRAIEITAPGGPDALRLTHIPTPAPGQGEILIRLAYAGVNRPDVLQRMGAYAPPPDANPRPGLEGAGEVAAIGPGVTQWAVGDRVCALLPGGGYAEYVTCAASHALPVPEGMTLREAAGLCETAFTVWSNMVQRGGLRAGERFLVHGGTSGIGTMAIQIARALGARVWASAGSDAKCAAITALGATAINYRSQAFEDVLQAEGGADLILDMVGGDYIKRNLKALAEDGRLVFIAFLGGPKAEINWAPIMARRLTVTGSTLRPQSLLAKARIADALRENLWPLIAAGKVRVLIDSEFALEQAADAHRHMENGSHIGKILLKIA
ncbi:MAG: NAD(P)H-quinone oxidoreductase [Paracoccus sp. (in: a-proteobacteria)]|uniref:NAD(P)H-quinone oxidoreductase n=1 Tax=Paracoccus sp. TaxID=267 RepID=UPI0026E00D22|nr:NAD(P)H-quinone oxidoreductase [Paracoccus sp. (in: a-proteobacteria)]MDO5622122.1 NAD(P)H-quinone oxidoreductase [Paracoccus sp. (in: a-proteobacteria)]